MRALLPIGVVGLLTTTLACTGGEPVVASQPAAADSAAVDPPVTKPVTKPVAPELEPKLKPLEPVAVMDPVDGFFMAAGAPQPRACTVAEDCKGDTIPDLANPCCQNPRTLEAHAWAYTDWLNKWRAEHCSEVTCPPPPSPSRPPDCAFAVSCVGGRCTDQCA